jgi:hypothetical protein
VTAAYRLSEAGRKASLLNGGDGRAEQRITIAVPITRLHFVHVDGNGAARLKLRPQSKLTADQRIGKIKLAPVCDQPPTLDELFQEAARNHEFERTYHAQRTTTQSTRQLAHGETAAGSDHRRHDATPVASSWGVARLLPSRREVCLPSRIHRHRHVHIAAQI